MRVFLLFCLVFSSACSSAPKHRGSSAPKHRGSGAPKHKDSSVSRTVYDIERLEVKQGRKPPHHNLKSVWLKNRLYTQPHRPHTWRVLLLTNTLKAYSRRNGSHTQATCNVSLHAEYEVIDIDLKRSRLHLQDDQQKICGWVDDQDVLLMRHPMLNEGHFVYFYPKSWSTYIPRMGFRPERLDYHGFVFKQKRVRGVDWLYVSPVSSINDPSFKRDSGWVRRADVYISKQHMILPSVESSSVNVSLSLMDQTKIKVSLLSDNLTPQISLMDQTSERYRVLIEDSASHQYQEAYLSVSEFEKHRLKVMSPLMIKTKQLMMRIIELMKAHRDEQIGREITRLCTAYYTEPGPLSTLCRHKELHDEIMEKSTGEVDAFFSEDDAAPSLAQPTQLRYHLRSYLDGLSLSTDNLEQLQHDEYIARSKFYEWWDLRVQ